VQQHQGRSFARGKIADGQSVDLDVMLLNGHVHPLWPLISVILPFVNSKTGRIAPAVYELASLASFLHRVEAPLDVLERHLHAVVAAPGLRAPLVRRKDASHTGKKMCKNSDCQFPKERAKKRVRYEPNATGSPYQDISRARSRTIPPQRRRGR